ncbi:MAG: hypothetical protein WAK01_11865 [Methylocystis sp.]
MNSLWRFQPRESQIAEQWVGQIFADGVWRIVKPVGSGESGSFEVVRSDGMRGYAKPAFQAGTNVPRAAHEKIAADLGFKLKIPIPPSVLWKDGANGLFSISLSAFRQPITWQQAMPIITQKFFDNASTILAAGLVLHSWIGDSDHNNHPGNIVVDAECSEDVPSIAFIDHAFSMSHSWNCANHTVTRISPYYFIGTSTPLQSHFEAAVRRIEVLADADIEEVVRRIPDLYLEESRANIIVENLIQRRADLVRCFGV